MDFADKEAVGGGEEVGGQEKAKEKTDRLWREAVCFSKGTLVFKGKFNRSCYSVFDESCQ